MEETIELLSRKSKKSRIHKNTVNKYKRNLNKNKSSHNSKQLFFNSSANIESIKHPYISKFSPFSIIQNGRITRENMNSTVYNSSQGVYLNKYLSDLKPQMVYQRENTRPILHRYSFEKHSFHQNDCQKIKECYQLIPNHEIDKEKIHRKYQQCDISNCQKSNVKNNINYACVTPEESPSISPSSSCLTLTQDYCDRTFPHRTSVDEGNEQHIYEICSNQTKMVHNSNEQNKKITQKRTSDKKLHSKVRKKLCFLSLN